MLPCGSLKTGTHIYTLLLCPWPTSYTLTLSLLFSQPVLTDLGSLPCCSLAFKLRKFSPFQRFSDELLLKKTFRVYQAFLCVQNPLEVKLVRTIGQERGLGVEKAQLCDLKGGNVSNWLPWCTSSGRYCFECNYSFHSLIHLLLCDAVFRQSRNYKSCMFINTKITDQNKTVEVRIKRGPCKKSMENNCWPATFHWLRTVLLSGRVVRLSLTLPLEFHSIIYLDLSLVRYVRNQCRMSGLEWVLPSALKCVGHGIKLNRFCFCCSSVSKITGSHQPGFFKSGLKQHRMVFQNLSPCPEQYTNHCR